MLILRGLHSQFRFLGNITLVSERIDTSEALILCANGALSRLGTNSLFFFFFNK